jgi:hypothetical protein
MKIKSLIYLTFCTLALIALSLSAHAQTFPNTDLVFRKDPQTGNNPAVLSPSASIGEQIGTIVPNIGQLFTVNGQTFLISTNPSGGLSITTTGPAGTNTVTPPTSLAGAFSRAQEFVNANMPGNIGYYSTNGEWDVSVGGVFAQNSGQAAAQLSIERYGVFKSLPNLSLGAAVLEGNDQGKSGTAGGYVFVDYRRPIGDVAFVAGLGGGYDIYNRSPMGIVKIEIEYRQNKHLGRIRGRGLRDREPQKRSRPDHWRRHSLRVLNDGAIFHLIAEAG